MAIAAACVTAPAQGDDALPSVASKARPQNTAGVGSQAAVVYHGAVEVMPPDRSEFGPPYRSSESINRALQWLGVVAKPGCDEFETVGLGHYRDFEDLFKAYHEPEL